MMRSKKMCGDKLASAEIAIDKCNKNGKKGKKSARE